MKLLLLLLLCATTGETERARAHVSLIPMLVDWDAPQPPAPAPEPEPSPPDLPDFTDALAAQAAEIKSLRATLASLQRKLDEKPKQVNVSVVVPKGDPIHWYTSIAQGKSVGRREGKPIFLYFGRDNCPYCKMALSALQNNVEYLQEHFVCVRIDTTVADKSILQDYGVEGVPALRGFDSTWTAWGYFDFNWEASNLADRDASCLAELKKVYARLTSPTRHENVVSTRAGEASSPRVYYYEPQRTYCEGSYFEPNYYTGSGGYYSGYGNSCSGGSCSGGSCSSCGGW